MRWLCERAKAVAMHVQETILQRLGKALNVRLDDVTHEPLPQRWIDLIKHLNEEERAQERARNAVQKRRERRE